MKVTIVSSTHDPIKVLLFTKQTRLNMTPGLLEEIRAWPEEKKMAELAYMAKTIPSSWEFIDVSFLIEGVSRACAQQITRTRQASYAMQSQRVTDVRGMEVVKPKMKDYHQEWAWNDAVSYAKAAYAKLVQDGMPLEDARGILPINTACNLVAKYNLRALVDLLKARASLRAQGEYGEVARLMKAETLALWPWAEPFFADKHAVAIKMLEDAAKAIGITTGHGPGWDIAKAIDLLRKE